MLKKSKLENAMKIIILILVLFAISCSNDKMSEKDLKTTGTSETKITDEYEKKTGLKIEKRKEIYQYLANLQDKVSSMEPTEYEKTYAKTAENFKVGIDTVRIIAVEGSKKMWPIK